MRLVDEKITKLRKAKKSNQFVFAEAIHTHPLTVSNVETGKSKYSDDSIKLAKIHLDIVGMPLTDEECEVSKVRLYYMRDHIRDGRLQEARNICDEMAKIVNLEPVDKYLPMLFRLFEVVLLLAEYNIDAAEEKLSYLQRRIEDMNDEHRFYFYNSIGELTVWRDRHENALDYYKQALDFSTNIADLPSYENARLHCHVAYIYSYLEYPNRTIIYLLKNRDALNNRANENITVASDLILALNYIKIESLKEAEILLQSCLILSKSIKDDALICRTLHYYGFMYMKYENWKIAEEYFDQALQYCEKGSPNYLAVLQRKILCIVKSRDFPKVRKLLKETKPHYHKCETFSIYFEALGHYLTISSRMSIFSNDESVKYIETKAIPHFRKVCAYFLAIEYYKLLEAYYENKNKKKSFLMSVEIRKIYERCFLYQ